MSCDLRAVSVAHLLTCERQIHHKLKKKICLKAPSETYIHLTCYLQVTMIGREQKESENLVPEILKLGTDWCLKDQKWTRPTGLATAALQALLVTQWPTLSPGEPSETLKNQLKNKQGTVSSAVQLMCYTRTLKMNCSKSHLRKEKLKVKCLYIEGLQPHSLTSFPLLTSEQVSFKSPSSSKSNLNVFFKGSAILVVLNFIPPKLFISWGST